MTREKLLVILHNFSGMAVWNPAGKTSLRESSPIEVSGECMLLASVSSQQRFGPTDVKALGKSQL